MAPPQSDTTVSHPRIQPGSVSRRDYQVAIAHEALRRNTLVILPTGMGKTVVALLVAADRLARPGKILLLAPTKPLVEQHARFFKEHVVDASVEAFTGETSPEEREYAWKTTTIICSTPQVIQNDVVSGRIDLNDVSLLLFDEAHRAIGNYAYVFLADAYQRARRLDKLTLALTASPGGKAEKIRDICQNLHIEGVEVRTEADADTAPYVQDTEVEWKVVQVPETLKHVAALLRQMFDERISLLRAVGGLPPHIRFVSKKALLDAQRAIAARVKGGETDGDLYKAMSAQAAALKLSHALELVETQGVGSLINYLERLLTDESKAAKAIREDPRTLEVSRLLGESKVDHPKIRQVAVLLRQQLKEKPDARILVFTNYRDTAEALVEQLKQVDGVKPARFVGQASRSETDRGMSQKKQVQMVDDFKSGLYNVLVATSVAEEGLDIPQVDLVVFYEPVPSEIRAIQRRGRTGRRRAGRVVILITKETRDETYHWASRGKEQKMKKEIDVLKKYFAKVNASEDSTEWKSAYAAAQRPAAEKPLDAFQSQEPKEEPKLTIIADHREFNGAVVREFSKAGCIVKPETLEVGDYVLSDRIAVERKEAADFATSLMDGRLFTQVKALRDSYTSPVLIIEGEGLLTARRIHEDAIYSAIASIVTDFHVTVLSTKDAAESAKIMLAIARREQTREARPLAVRAQKGPMSDDEKLRFIVEGLPNVSAVLARRLLDKFGTVRAIANAKIEELAEVDGIGVVSAKAIHEIVRAQYVGRSGK